MPILRRSEPTLTFVASPTPDNTPCRLTEHSVMLNRTGIGYAKARSEAGKYVVSISAGGSAMIAHE